MKSFEEFLSQVGIEQGENTQEPVATETVPSISPEAGYLLDGDTYALPTGDKVRLSGINTREITQLDPSTGLVKSGQAYGGLQKEVVQRIIDEQGFNIPVYDKKTKDTTGTRFMGDLANPQGEYLTDYMLSRGIGSPSPYMDDTARTKFAVGKLSQAQRKSDEAADRFDKANRGEYKYTDQGDYYSDLLNGVMSSTPLEAKPFAYTAKQYGQNPDYYAGPMVVRQGEDRRGFATSNLSTGLDYGINSLIAGYQGSLNMASELLNYQPGKDFSEAKLKQLKAESEDLPFLRNAEAFDQRNGEWKLDTFSKVFDYSVATAAQSAPDMLGAVLAYAAAGPTFGASLLAPVARYSGEIWNGQEKKDATWAIGGGIVSTALDRIGLGGISKAINSKEMIKEAIERKVKEGMPQEVAEKFVIQEVKKVSTQVFDTLKAFGTGGTTEGITEALQQLTQYVSTTKGTIEDPVEFKNQILNAAFGGFVLGGGISGAGRAYNNLTVNPTNSAQPSDVEFRERVKKDPAMLDATGQLKSTVDIINDAALITENEIQETTLEKIGAFEASKRAMAGVPATIKNWWKDKGLQSLYGKYGDSIIQDRGYRGPFMAALATLVGSNKAVNGGDFASNEDLIAGNIRSSLTDLKGIQGLFNDMRLSDISKILYRPDVQSYIASLENKNNIGDVDFNLAYEQTKDNNKLNDDVKQYARAIATTAARFASMVSTNNQINNKSNSLAEFFANRSLNRNAVAKNRDSFLTDIKQVLNVSDKDALTIFEKITNPTTEASVEDLLNLGSPTTGTRKQLLQDLLAFDTKGIMNKYFLSNAFDNATAFAFKGGKEYVNKKLIGENGSHFASLLSAALKNNEITNEEASFMAHELQDLLKIREGTYKEIKSPLYKGALDTVTFLATLASLPLATISSIPEAAQVMRNLNTTQSRKAYQRLLSNTVQEMGNVFKELGSREVNYGLESRNRLSRLGFNTGDQNVADRYDIHSGAFQEWTNSFFKLIGLQGFTNATRFARLSVAGDAINNWTKTVAEADTTNMTQQEQDAYEHLVRIGVDPFKLNDLSQKRLDALNEGNGTLAEMYLKEYIQEVDRGTYNFVNEAVVHPNVLNRPKFYNDPYLRLFTTFQGYISTFTATILPRLYGDLGKKGSPDQKNAMLTIATMIALTMLAQALKDMIKYGETPPEWLKGDGTKLGQRLVGATGLTGTGERVINFVHPLVEQKAESGLEKLYNILEGESPAISYSAKVLKAVNSVLSPESDKEIKKIAKVTPLIGSLNQLADHLQEKLGGN